MNMICKNGLRAIGVAAALAGLGFAAVGHAATARVCPKAAGEGPELVIAALDTGSVSCWEGPNWENGSTWAAGQVTTTSGSGRSVGAYAYYGLEHNPPSGGWDGRAYVQGFNSSNVATCAASDYTGNGAWSYNTSSACNNTTYAKVEAYVTVLH